MKNISFLMIFGFLLTAMSGFAQTDTDTLRIKTSAVCGTCKKTIEHNLSFEKGVKSAKQDVSSGTLTVIYRSDKTNPEKIRLAVTKIGYDADSMKADPKSFNRLPECCKDPEKHH